MHRLTETGQRLLMIGGRYDPTFWYEFTEEMFDSLRRKGVRIETMTLSCGHYSLELAPFAYPAALRLGLFLFEALA
jgi:pyruvate-formate lyase-activating enzyme